ALDLARLKLQVGGLGAPRLGDGDLARGGGRGRIGQRCRPALPHKLHAAHARQRLAAGRGRLGLDVDQTGELVDQLVLRLLRVRRVGARRGRLGDVLVEARYLLQELVHLADVAGDLGVRLRREAVQRGGDALRLVEELIDVVDHLNAGEARGGVVRRRVQVGGDLVQKVEVAGGRAGVAEVALRLADHAGDDVGLAGRGAGGEAGV